MAPTRKSIVKARPTASEKEKQRPTKAKRTVSVSTMFKPARYSKSLHQSGIHQKSYPTRSKGAGSGDLHRAFAGTILEYRKGAAYYKSEKLEPAYRELAARVEGDDDDAGGLEKRLNTSKSELEVLVSEQSMLSDSLESETIAIQSTRKESGVEIEYVKLGDTMQAFQKLVNIKRAQFKELVEELRQVDAEIDAVGKELRAIEKTDVKVIKRDWNAALARQAEEACRVRDWTMAAVDVAVKEDKKANEASSRKLRDALSGL